MKFLKYIGIVVISFVFLIVVFVLWASRPLLNSKQWPHHQIIQYFQPSTPTITPQKITLVTYNMGYASGQKNNDEPLSKDEATSNLDEIVKILKEANADIIALQEVDFLAARSFNVNQMEYIARALHMPFAAAVTNWNLKYLAFPYWPPRRHFGSMLSGQCLLSRYPLTEQVVHTFPKPADNDFWYNWFNVDRVIQQVTVQLGQKQAVVWNVHLEAFQAKARRIEAEQTGQSVSAKTNDIKFALGDFNSFSFSKDPQHSSSDPQAFILFQTTSGLKNAEPSNEFFTFPSVDPADKIDHIFYSPAVRLESIAPIISMASDHLPVKAVFILK